MVTFAFDHAAVATLVGHAGECSLDVTDQDTAIAAGSGDLAVLATPRMIALMEQAACAALAAHLPAAVTSVGSHVEVRHRAPTPIGVTVTARAVISEVDRARVTFVVTARHVIEGVIISIGEGTHTRVVVDRAQFGALPEAGHRA